MKMKNLENVLKRISFLGVCMIFGLVTAVSAAAASGPSCVTDTPGKPVQRTVAQAPGVTNALTQPPNEANGFFSDPGCSICGSGQQSIADNFVLGSSLKVNQIVLWGGYFPANTPLTVDDFTVIIHRDNAGVPGTVVYNRSGIVPTERTDTGVNIFGVDEYRFTLDLPNPSTLAAGTYWVEIFNDTTAVTDDFFWETGTLDATNGIASSVWATVVPGANWMTNDSTDMAFQIYGVQPTANIPTMNEWGMIILTLLIAGFSMRMIKQRKTEI